jgi:tripartite-type tricarboxylate transporter receptor subunit TctC
MTMKLMPYLRPSHKTLLSILLTVSATALQAQEVYPSRAITMIIPLSAGSQVDALGRALADSISKQAGQPVVVINREGAGMVLGMDVVAKARPDGYTVAFGPDAPLSQTPHLRSNVPYKTSDFDLVCRTSIANMAVVTGPTTGFKRFDDVIAAARKSPGKLNYGTAGVGTPPHLLMEAVAAELGIKLNHIPFRSISDIAVQTMNGSVDFTVTVPNMLVVNAARGMQGLALTGDTRMTELPDVPLVRDYLDKSSPTASYGVGGLGIYAPKSLRPEAMSWLRKACKTATESTSFATASTNTLTPMNHAEGPDFLRNMQAASKVTEEIVRKLNLKLD